MYKINILNYKIVYLNNNTNTPKPKHKSQAPQVRVELNNCIKDANFITDPRPMYPWISGPLHMSKKGWLRTSTEISLGGYQLTYEVDTGRGFALCISNEYLANMRFNIFKN
jgi:hypothetical protein